MNKIRLTLKYALVGLLLLSVGVVISEDPNLAIAPRILACSAALVFLALLSII